MLLKDSQKLGPLALKLVDSRGIPVADPKFDSDPTWALSDASMGELVKQDAGLFFVPAAKLGKVKVQFSASLDGKALAGESEEIEVIAGAADHVEISLGESADA